MIQYHVMALLCLVVSALTAIEALWRFTQTPEKMSNPLGWLMVALFGGSIALYFSVRKKRKNALGKRN